MEKWYSKNGKWAIEGVEDKGENKYLATCRFVSKDLEIKVHAICKDMEFSVTEIYGTPASKLPKFIRKQIHEIILGKTGNQEQAATVAAPAVNSIRTLEGLVEEANNFLKKNFDMALNIPIEFNGRLKSTLGRFRHYTHGKAINIEMSKKTMQYYTEDEIKDVLQHECVHYALFSKGEPHTDGHPNFEGWLKKLGVGSTGTLKGKGKYHFYTCQGCGKPIYLQRHLNQKKVDSGWYNTKCCNKKLEYKGTRIKD